MPLNSFLFDNKSLVEREKEKIYVNILSFLNPQSFLETVKLAHFFSNDETDTKTQSLQLAKSLDEIKQSGAEIFAKKDTYLTAKVEQMNGGLTNACFKLKTPKDCFFLRVPGKGSEEHLSRADEAYNVKIAHSLGFNIEIFFINPQTGLYVGEFIKDATPLTTQLLSEQKTMADVAAIFKTLHTNPNLFRNNCDIFTRLRDLIKKIENYQHTLLHDRSELESRLDYLFKSVLKIPVNW